MNVSLSLGFLSALQLLAGLLGQIFVIKIVGIGWQTDAYIAAQALPMILTAVVAASLQGLWLPRFSRAADSDLSWNDELSIALGQTLKIKLLLALPLWATSSVWSQLIFSGFSELQQGVVVGASGPLLAAACLAALSGILTTAMRARGRFILPEAFSLGAWLANLAGVFLLVPHYGVIAAAWLSAVRGLLVLGLLLIAANYPRLRLQPTEQSREVTIQARPLIGGNVFIKSGPLVDRYLGSHAGNGEMTTFTVSQLAIGSAATILEKALLAQDLPSFAKQLKSGGPIALWLAYKKCQYKIILAALSVGVGLVAARPIWDQVCAQLFHMSPETARQFWLISISLLPSLFVYIAGSAAVAVFYAFGETRLPTIISILGFIVSVILKSMLFHQYGIIGIGFGVSGYLIFNMILYHIAVIRRLHPSSV